MSALAPHPWDSLGEPPRPGLPYDDVASPLPIEAALGFAIKWRGIESKRDEARDLEDEADELERKAKELEAALATVPGLADAIGESPWAFGTAQDVRDWCETKGRQP